MHRGFPLANCLLHVENVEHDLVHHHMLSCLNLKRGSNKTKVMVLLCVNLHTYHLLFKFLGILSLTNVQEQPENENDQNYQLPILFLPGS